MREAETYIKKEGVEIQKNEKRRSDTFKTRSKITGREVVLNDRFADLILDQKGYDHVPKIIGHFSGLEFDEEGNII